MSGINYSEKIPNNVNLANDRTLQRALEHWQPHFLDWWTGMGPSDFQKSDVYLRTATSVDAEGGPAIALSNLNFGAYPMVNGDSRLSAHYCGEVPQLERGKLLDAKAASKLGLVTATPDDIDWEDEVRIAVEERASLSPDALTGMEASLRFTGRENMLTRVFGRLSAWQNWIFIRPNAVGEKGALTAYGSQSRPEFDFNRT